MNNNLNNYRSLKVLLLKQADYLTPKAPQLTVPDYDYGITNTSKPPVSYASTPATKGPETFANPFQKRVMEGAPSATPNLPPMNPGMGLPTLPHLNQVGKRDFANTKAAPRGFNQPIPTLTLTTAPGYGVTNY